MECVEPFSHAMIESFLEHDGLHYLRDQEGDFVVQFSFDEEIKGHPRFLLAISGDDQEQYCLRGDTLQRIDRPDWNRTLSLCNEWNAQYKMPKVYLQIDDPSTSTSARVVCEQWVDLEVGVHQDLVNHLTRTFLGACFGFWRWLVRQNEINELGSPDGPDPTPPETETETDRVEEEDGLT